MVLLQEPRIGWPAGASLQSSKLPGMALSLALLSHAGVRAALNVLEAFCGPLLAYLLPYRLHWVPLPRCTETQRPLLSPLATLRPGGVGGSQQWILKCGSEHSTLEVGEEGGHPVPAGRGCICTLPHLQEAP